MPKPRKSIAELAATGTLQKNSGRYMTRIAAIPGVVHPLGGPPRHLTKPEKQVWVEIARTAPHGLLARSHRISIEVLVKLLLRVRCNDAKTSEFNAVMNLLSKFGMDPASRQRMDLAPELDSNQTAAQRADAKAWADLAELD